MRTKLFLLVTIIISYYSYAQSCKLNVSVDSTEIRIIGNDIYRVHKEFFKNKIAEGTNTDSVSVKFVKSNPAKIYFKQSKAEIKPSSINDLNNLFALLVHYPKIQVQINGYADKVGSKKSNSKLSYVRSRMIKRYLKRKGVNPKRISTNGYGDTSLVCKPPCDKNQRVEFVLTMI